MVARAGKAGLSFGVEGTFPGLVFGVDEVGRGPLAGPVTAAAVCLFPDAVPPGLGDSKKVARRARERIAAALQYAAVAEASVAEIDALNILRASHVAMARAVAALVARLGPPAMVLVDGNMLPPLSYPARAIVGGDGKIAAIAAASIAAKVARDARMRALDPLFPGYGWARNMGYPTREHLQALERLGPTPWHRKSFAPVARRIAGAAAAAKDRG